MRPKRSWRSRQSLTVLETAPSCCVPSRNQMMVAAGLALKARHVRLWGVPACSRSTGPPSILVSSGGTVGKSKAKSVQGSANTALITETPAVSEGIPPSACPPQGEVMPPLSPTVFVTVLLWWLHPRPSAHTAFPAPHRIFFPSLYHILILHPLPLFNAIYR